MALTNAEISELLAAASEEQEGGSNKERALRRASRAALFWPVEAASLVQGDRPLTDLASVGPWVAGVLSAWLASDDPSPPPEPPESRRGFLTLAEVRATLAGARGWPSSLRADLQMHTTYSDGVAPLREMALAAADHDYEFIAITDHSRGLKNANGMDEARLAAQGEEIQKLNGEMRRRGIPLRALRSIEMDISPEGDEDMDRESLARLDLVMGAFHSKLRLKEDQTERYLKALRNPTITTLAHPRGRMFNRRVGLSADWPRVFEEAARLDKAVEIDANPNRQDLDVELLMLARDAGVRISIGSDAHSVFELRFMEFGLALAIRAGIPQERIINFRPVEEVLDWSARIRDLP